MADLYFFEVVWEVGCLREDEWKTGRCVLRSAVQVVSDSLFRFGPDMLEVEDPYVCPDPDGLIGMAARNAGLPCLQGASGSCTGRDFSGVGFGSQ